MSSATPAVISAALGLLVGYDSAVAQVTNPHVVRHENQKAHQDLANDIHGVVKSARDLEATFKALAKRCTEGDVRRYVKPEGYAHIGAMLKDLRGVEIGLKSASVPVELADLHMSARRAIASGRSWVAAVHLLASQAYEAPETFESDIDLEGLRALAEHSTKRLVQLANA